MLKLSQASVHPAVLIVMVGLAESVMLKDSMPTPLLGPEPAAGNGTGTALAGKASTPSNRFT